MAVDTARQVKLSLVLIRLLVTLPEFEENPRPSRISLEPVDTLATRERVAQDAKVWTVRRMVRNRTNPYVEVNYEEAPRI